MSAESIHTKQGPTKEQDESKAFHSNDRWNRQRPCAALRLYGRRVRFHYQLRHQISNGEGAGRLRIKNGK